MQVLAGDATAIGCLAMLALIAGTVSYLPAVGRWDDRRCVDHAPACDKVTGLPPRPGTAGHRVPLRSWHPGSPLAGDRAYARARAEELHLRQVSYVICRPAP